MINYGSILRSLICINVLSGNGRLVCSSHKCNAVCCVVRADITTEQEDRGVRDTLVYICCGGILLCDTFLGEPFGMEPVAF